MRIHIYSRIDPPPCPKRDTSLRVRANRALERWGNVVLYVLALGVLFATRLWPLHPIVMLGPVVAFAAYDIWFLRSCSLREGPGRTEDMSKRIRTASQYTGTFLGLAGVVLSIMMSNVLGQQALSMFRDAWLAAYGVGVLAGAATLLLFIPVPYGTPDTPSHALRSCFFVVMLLQKCVVLLLVYLLLELLANVVTV